MAGLIHAGPDDTHPRSIETRLSAEQTLTEGVSRAYVIGRVTERMAARASKTYVDTADATYAPAAYFAQRDALLVPLTARGVPSGLATLDAGVKVPVSQMPVLGAGMLRGPWGADQSFGGTTNDTPIKIAQWDLGATGVTGQPLVFLSTSVQSTDGVPVVEIRMGNSAQTSYASQKLIGLGVGRSYYSDYQTITVLPCAATPNEGQDGVQDTWHPATDLIVNAWLYDSDGGQSTTQVGSIATAALYMARTAL